MAGVDTGTAYSSVRVRLDQLDQDLKGVYSRLDNMESYIKGSTAKATKSASSSFGVLRLAGVAAFTAIGVAAKNSITTFAQFDQSMANVASVAGASSLEMDQLKQAASDAGETTRYTASQAADALYYLASAGFSATQSTQALNGVLQLAQATGSDLASTSSSMAATISQFGLAASDAGRVSNVFAAAITSSQANMEKLTTGLRQVGPVAGTLNISLEEVVSNLDALYNKGFQGEQAGTALRSILLDLVDPSSAVVAALKKQGLEYGKVNPRVVGITGAFNNMAKAGVDLTTVFGKISASEALALIDTAKKAEGNLNDLETAVTGTEKAGKSAATQNDTLSGSFDIMVSKAQAMTNVMNDNVKPALRALIDTAGNLFAGISKLPSIFQTLIATGLAATGVMTGLAGALKLVGIAVSGSAFGIVVAALTAVGAVAVTVANKFNEQKNVTEQLNTATLALQKTSDDYNKVQDQLNDKTKTLTDSERRLLENRKALLALDLQKQLNNLAKSYTKTKKTLDSLNTSIEQHNNDYNTYLDLADKTQKQIDKINAQDKITLTNRVQLRQLEETLNTYRKLAVKENGKYLESEEDLKKGNGDLEQSLVSLAQGVSNGSINIEWLKKVNLDLYNDIMAHTPAEESAYDKIKDRIAELGNQSGDTFDKMKSSILDDINNTITDVNQKQELVKALNAVKKAGDNGAASLTKWQQALKDALNVENVSSGKVAVAEYTQNLSSELSKALDVARTTGGDVARVYEDYADKVRTAVSDLIMSGQYTGKENTIQQLVDAAGSFDLAAWFYSADDASQTYADNLNTITIGTQEMQNVASSAFQSIFTGIESIGEAIGEGTLAWSTWGKAGLTALSSTLKALGNELSALAVEAAVKQLIASLGFAASIPIALAGAAAAYLAAGVASGAAANMATGGIVAPTSGGTITRQAENGYGEVDFNTGPTGQDFIKQMGAAIASQIGGSGNQTIVLQLDGKEVTRVVTRRQRNGDY